MTSIVIYQVHCYYIVVSSCNWFFLFFTTASSTFFSLHFRVFHSAWPQEITIPSKPRVNVCWLLTLLCRFYVSSYNVLSVCDFVATCYLLQDILRCFLFGFLLYCSRLLVSPVWHFDHLACGKGGYLPIVWLCSCCGCLRSSLPLSGATRTTSWETNMRATKAQISLCIRAVWTAPLLFAA